MADEIKIKWVYPPNFTGTYDTTDRNGHKRHIIHCTNYSDGTGEDDSIKVKRTDLLTPTGNIPATLVIEKIKYNVGDMTVRISYNNENDEEAAILSPNSEGLIEFRAEGGYHPEPDGGAGGGDIVFTTEGASSGDSYNIILTVRPHS